MSGFDLQKIQFKVVEDNDQWLQTAYDLLGGEFEEDVLDPRERYVEWLDLNREHADSFPLLMVAAYYPLGEQAVITGVISGNIMKIDDHEGPQGERPAYIYAIAHQATSQILRSKGIKGVGRNLLGFGTSRAGEMIEALGGNFHYSVLVAEKRSIGYFSKMGFRWPQGVSYWQPPAQFDSAGVPLHSEAPGLLMLKSEARGPAATSISRSILQKVISTVYSNWSLSKYRPSLSENAYRNAEQYVMGKVFGKVCESMPHRELLDLVMVGAGAQSSPTGHFRTVALSQGKEHGLIPLKAHRLGECTDFDHMIDMMKDMAFGARMLGNAADVLYQMATDRECKVVLTLSGAVTIAKMDLIIAEMIERGLVHCIVSTGAIFCHGLNSERGSTHFKAPEDASDPWLYEQGYNRIYDTIEPETALDELEQLIGTVLDDCPVDQPLCSSDLLNRLGKYLVEHGLGGNGVIQSAYSHGVPVFIPAFTDSELGLDFAIYNYYRSQQGLPELQFNPFIDFVSYCDFIHSCSTCGILTLGGGVPRNWAQQIGPYSDTIERRKSGTSQKSRRFKYGVRICPDPPYWGGLSGATYSEAVTWGKFIAPDEGGMFAEVFSDFTLVFPVLVKALFERLDKLER